MTHKHVCQSAIPNRPSQYQCTYQFWRKSIDICSSYRPETKIRWTCGWTGGWKDRHSNKRVLIWLSRVILILMWLFYSPTSWFLATEFKICMYLRNKSHSNTLKLSVKYSEAKYSFVCTDRHTDGHTDDQRGTIILLYITQHIFIPVIVLLKIL